LKPVLDLSEDELEIVRAILRSHLPIKARVYAFGSRANGRAKPWSDLDLLIDVGATLPLSTLAGLADAFDESSLAWKVDLVDQASVSSDFGKLIDAAKLRVI
jgi:uncharacterized protein